MINSYKFGSSRIKIRSFDSSIKDLFIPYTTRKKKNIFIKKKKKKDRKKEKITKTFDLKCAILKRYEFESTKKIEINSEVTKNENKFFLHTLLNMLNVEIGIWT